MDKDSSGKLSKEELMQGKNYCFFYYLISIFDFKS